MAPERLHGALTCAAGIRGSPCSPSVPHTGGTEVCLPELSGKLPVWLTYQFEWRPSPPLLSLVHEESQAEDGPLQEVLTSPQSWGSEHLHHCLPLGEIMLVFQAYMALPGFMYLTSGSYAKWALLSIEITLVPMSFWSVFFFKSRERSCEVISVGKSKFCS